MTMTDARPDFEDPAQEAAALNRLRQLREARDAAQKALQEAIVEQRAAGLYDEVINTAVNECPAWCDRSSTTAGRSPASTGTSRSTRSRR